MTSKKREMNTTVISTTADRHNHHHQADNELPERSRLTSDVDEQRQTKKNSAVHAAKRKKLARNEKLVPSDECEPTDHRKQIPPTTDTSGTDRKSTTSAKDAAADRSETALAGERVKSTTTAGEKSPRTDAETVVESKTKPGHVTASDKPEVPSVAASSTGSGSVAVEKAVDKDRADILDVDVDDDDVTDTFALFAAQVKSTSGAADARKPADKELPVSRPLQADSYDQSSTGGSSSAVITMADSGYQTYDHDLSALDGGRQVSSG